MTNSFPNRSSISPFRKTVNFNTIDDRSSKNKKQERQSLKIITSPVPNEVQQKQQEATPTSSISSPSRVRQRLSSLFRSSSPVVMTLKETFNNKRASLSTVSLSAALSEQEEDTAAATTTTNTSSPQQMEPMDDSHSTTTSLSSDSFDHMPASPADARTIFSSRNNTQQQQTVWQPSVTILSYEDDNKVAPSTTLIEKEEKPSQHQFARTRTSSSLAFQVHQILGSALEEVDEEIDQDWENSRNVLHQTLISTGDSRNRHFKF